MQDFFHQPSVSLEGFLSSFRLLGLPTGSWELVINWGYKYGNYTYNFLLLKELMGFLFRGCWGSG